MACKPRKLNINHKASAINKAAYNNRMFNEVVIAGLALLPASYFTNPPPYKGDKG